jgi:hypothetical protein
MRQYTLMIMDFIMVRFRPVKLHPTAFCFKDFSVKHLLLNHSVAYLPMM